MFKKIVSSMLVAASLCAHAQSGPLGRAIKATQVTLFPTNVATYLDWTSNFVLQDVIEDFDTQFGEVNSSFMQGTNITNATYDPTTLTWGGLGNMQGTNITNATYDPTTLTWGGLGNMPGTNISWSSYAESNQTWTSTGHLPESYFFWAGNNGGEWGGSPVKTITSGAAFTKNSLSTYITSTNVFSDAGGWLDVETGVLTIPVDGLYDIRYSCSAYGTSAMLGYLVNGAPGAIPAAGGWSPGATSSGGTLWAGYDAFQAGDELEFVYVPRETLTPTVYISQFFIYLRLVGPFPTGDFMSFKGFNEQ